MTAAVDFLGIGVQKAATTWLWARLREHPEIWMPPRKELHYFDRSLRYPSPSHLATESRLARAFSRRPHDRRLRRRFREELTRSIAAGDWRAARWTMRYFWGGRDDRWYRSLFDQAGQRVRGEITPAYSILDDADVGRVARLFPHAKLLLLLRDPIDRAWSHAKYAAQRHSWLHEGPDLADVDAICRFIDSPVQSLRGDYVRTIETWTRHFPADRFWVGYHDDVATRPLDVLRGVCSHVGVAAPGAVRAGAERRVNVSHARRMPDAVRRHLVAKYLPEMRRLADLPLIGSHPHVLSWIRNAER